MFADNEPSMVFHSRGNIELLSQNKLAIFASRHTPDPLIPAIEEVFKDLLRLPISLAGGWQSPVEKRLLRLFEPRLPANVIHYFAREINDLKLTPRQMALLSEQKLLIIAPETTSKRANQHLVAKRDALLFAHCSKILFFYIEEGGRLQAYFDQLQQKPYSLFLLDDPLNEPFFSSNVALLNRDNLETLLAVRG